MGRFFVLIFLLPVSLLYSQDDSSKVFFNSLDKNNLYVQGGTVLVMSGFGLTYDRLISANERKMNSTSNTLIQTTTSLSVSNGWNFIFYYDEYFYSTVQLTHCYRKNWWKQGNWFEFKWGPLILLNANNWRKFEGVYPAISLGFKKEFGYGNLFRLGVNYPETFYLSLGKTF